MALIINQYQWFLLTTRAALFFPYGNVPAAFLTIRLSVFDLDFRHIGFLGRFALCYAARCNSLHLGASTDLALQGYRDPLLKGAT